MKAASQTCWMNLFWEPVNKFHYGAEAILLQRETVTAE